MPPVKPDPDAIRSFPSAAELERWLEQHHASHSELWLQIHKKASGLPTVTYAEALDIALCWGWIDGIRKSLNAESFLQRFTPRTAKSMWSVVNTQHVERLVREGRMRPHGQRQIDAAMQDGRWANAYAPGRDTQLPDDLIAAARTHPKARQLLESLNRQNQFALAFRLGRLKTPAARTRKIGEFVAMLDRGEVLYPNGAVATVRAAKKMAKKVAKKVAKKATAKKSTNAKPSPRR